MAESTLLYLRLVGARVRAQLQYRVSFALDAVSTGVISFLDFVVVLTLFHNAPAIGGWSIREVAFLYAVSSIAFAIADMTVGHLDQLPRLIRDGTFDLLLVRPRGTLFQVVVSDFTTRRVGRIVQGAVVLGWAAAGLHVDWTPGRVFAVPLMIVSGVAIFSAVWVAVACLCFLVVDGQEATSAFTYGASFLTQYPVNIYGPWLRRLLAFVVPMAFVAYEPTLYVLDRPDPIGLPEAARFAAPLVAVLSAIVAGLLWQASVRRYRSAGG